MNSQEFAAKLLAHLAAFGANNIYLAPGARSQALAIAAGQLSDSGKANLTIRVDERSLAFTALGRAMAEESPSVVITTSGTAVANLHPAVLEAHHSGVPMILLTADRPARLRGVGANQTTNQVGIFADAVWACIDVSVPELEQFDPADLARQAYDLAIGLVTHQAGPVQLNLQFQEPLSASYPNAAEVLTEPNNVSPNSPMSELDIEVHPQAVVVAGSQAGEAAVRFADAANLPLFAEPSSRARFGGNLVIDYPKKLNTELFDQVTQVFVFGKPTLSRSVLKLLSKAEVWVQNSPHGLFDLHNNALGFADILIPVGAAPPSWLEKWQSVAVETSTRGQLAQAVWNATASGEQIIFGASQIIREAESALAPKDALAFANRGLAGIDGTISTAIGLAQSGRKTRALMGDVTFFHDVASLNTSGLSGLDLQIVVGNDHGGEIFKRLEVAQSISEEQLNKLFLTPQSPSIENVSKAFGWNHIRCQDFSQLETAMQASGLWVIEFEL